MEADSTTVAVGNQDFVVTVRHADLDQAVVFAKRDSVHTVLARTGVRFEQGLFDDTFPRAEQQVVGVDELRVCRQLLDADESLDLVVGFDIEQVLDGAAFRVLCAFRNLVHLQPIATALGGEEEQRGVHRRGVDVFDEILVARLGALRSYSAPALRTEFAERRAFDIAHVRDGDNHLVVGVEILGIQFLRRIDNIRPTLIAVFVFDFLKLVFDDFHAKVVIFQNFGQICD